MIEQLHQTQTAHQEQAVLLDSDFRNRPLDMMVVAEIAQSPDPINAIKEISTIYPHTDFLAPIRTEQIKSCIDDRQRVGKAIPCENGEIVVHGKRYTFNRKTDEYLAQREIIGSRPWPGGRFGVDKMVFYESIASGDVYNQPFWYTEGGEFISGAMEYVLERSNRVNEGLNIPIHTDNEHGHVSTIGTMGVPNVQNIEYLLNRKRGCGDHENFLASVGGVLQVMGNQEEAEEYMAKVGGIFDENGVPQVDRDLAELASDLLYDNAIQQGAHVDIMIGSHMPTGVVFSFGDNSYNRRLAQMSLGPQLTFKVDLGVLKKSDSLAAQVSSRVHAEFGNGFDQDRFQRFVVSANLVTLLKLSQENIQRYYIE